MIGPGDWSGGTVTTWRGGTRRDDYAAFLASKAARHAPCGVSVAESGLHAALYAYQRAVVRWALRTSRAAIFADCGLGKTLMQLEWARHVAALGPPTLVVVPLAVADQTIREADIIGVKATRWPDASGEAVLVNYQRLHRVTGAWGGVVLDESSILKNLLGSVRSQIIGFAADIPHRLACTATPAPNDLTELLNHAAYLGVMSVQEAQAIWFTNDQAMANTWRLKGHAAADFWRWVSTWAVAFRTPQDIGHAQAGFDLPPYELHPHLSDTEPDAEDGRLFAAGGLQSYRRARNATVDDRVARCAVMVNASEDPWVVWCDLNAESSALARAIPDAVEVRGSDSIETKEERLRAFAAGQRRVIITKPSIAGHGLNWQHCCHVAFVGISHSYEQFYQAVRRVWRYGQRQQVHVHVFGAGPDAAIVETVRRKERTAMQIYDFVTPPDLGGDTPSLVSDSDHAPRETAEGEGWRLELGDSVETIASIEPGSIGLSVFSPPFPGMYVYTSDPRDMGNVKSIAQMIGQYSFLAEKLRTRMMPGRSVLIHITQGVAQKQRDGYVGLRDFRGDMIRCMVDAGFVHYGEVTVDKNPQVKAVRTKDAGLMFVSLERDSAQMHVAMPDMLLHFRAPGDNPEPVKPDVSRDEWIRWARPVWPAVDTDDDGIRETDTLNAAEARSPQDERHICPLQLGLIRRCVRLWSNAGDLVYSPFAGIGSEGVSALKLGRRFAGGEIKREYFDLARQHLAAVAAQRLLWGDGVGGGIDTLA